MSTPAKSKAKVNKNNSTGYNGVTKDAKGNYVAQIYHNGKTIVCGKFGASKADLIKAAKAYDAKAIELKGSKAKLNFPKAAAAAVNA